MPALEGVLGRHMAQVVTGISLMIAGIDIRPVTLRILEDNADNYFYQSTLVFTGQ
jgi:hypothetical protein